MQRIPSPTKPTCLTLFSGLGGGALGFQQAGFELVGAIDVDEEAIADYKMLTGSTRAHVRDISAMTPRALRTIVGALAPDVVFTSPPCLPAGEEIITPAGPVPIETLRAGSLVLTHKGRYRPVRRVGTHTYKGRMYGLRLNGSPCAIRFTAEHPIYVRRLVRSTGGIRILEGPKFRRADEVRVGDRVGFPVVPERPGCAAAFIDSFGDPQLTTRGGYDRPTPSGRAPMCKHIVRNPRVRDLRKDANTRALWYCLGVYLGDGYRRKDRTCVIFCVGPEGGELDVKLRECLDALDLNYSVTKGGGPSNIKVRVSSRHLWLITAALGDGAENKSLPEILFGLERDLIRALWEGYLDSDGSVVLGRTGYKGRDRARIVKATSISLPLLRGFQRLLLALGEWASIYKNWDGGPEIILGREVMTRPRWVLSMRLTPTKKRRVAEFTSGMVWTRIRAIDIQDVEESVWNLDVEEDDTFCAHMIATHNCKGFSGCLPSMRSKTTKYVQLNSLAEKSVWLLLEAWETPPKIILLENVPRIMSRGRKWLDAITNLLHAYGYAVTESTHDCGELGGLAQKRRRFLLIARHIEQVSPFVFEPPRQTVRGCGEVLNMLPTPLPVHKGEDAPGGEMHRLDKLSALNWLRLALIPPGKDWRALPCRVSLRQTRHATRRIEDTCQRAREIEREPLPSFDARLSCSPRATVFGVNSWGNSTGTIIGQARPDNGCFSVADPRVTCKRREGSEGIKSWHSPSTTVIANGSHFNGPWQVADPRGEALELATHRLIANTPSPCLEGPPLDLTSKKATRLIITAPSGCWHRPMTTMELALLQGFPPIVDGEWLTLSGGSKKRWRMRIGNAVPPPTSFAIAQTIMRTLEAARGGGWLMSSEKIWVKAPTHIPAPR